MQQPYSQFKAFIALFRAALISIAKSPSSVIFTLAFPSILILLFSFLGDRSLQTVNLGITSSSDTANYLLNQLKADHSIKINYYTNLNELQTDLEKGKIDIILDHRINKEQDVNYITIKSLNENTEKINFLKKTITYITVQHNTTFSKSVADKVHIQQVPVNKSKLSTIDFILPGQLGFALLASSIFGTAFVFYSLRQGLVLKRFFTTPIRKYNIILAECTARIVFQMAGAIFIILAGKYFLNYTLINGWITFLNMLVICILALTVFMSFGFIISSLANSESLIPPLANIIVLPQFLLAGTFFPIDVLPEWLQYIANIMPLTHLNNALRDIAFKGFSLIQVWKEIGILLLWGIASNSIASKLFKWE